MTLKIRDIRAGLLKLADKIAAIDREAAALHSAIPDSPRRNDMQEGDIPSDVATAMEGDIEILRADYLQPGSELARRAARLNKTTLQREWREAQESRQRALPKRASLVRRQPN
jgi:hypothetical protein